MSECSLSTAFMKYAVQTNMLHWEIFLRNQWVRSNDFPLLSEEHGSWYLFKTPQFCMYNGVDSDTPVPKNIQHFQHPIDIWDFSKNWGGGESLQKFRIYSGFSGETRSQYCKVLGTVLFCFYVLDFYGLPHCSSHFPIILVTIHEVFFKKILFFVCFFVFLSHFLLQSL